MLKSKKNFALDAVADDAENEFLAALKSSADRRWQCRQPRGSNAGFSLMELTVVVAVIGIIVAIALIFFGNAQDNARQAVVDTAARDGHVMVRTNIIQGDPTGGDLSQLETENVKLSLASTFVLGDESTVCVRADWIDGGDNYSVNGPCDESDTTAPIIDREPDDPLYTTLTYQCPNTKSGYLGVVNIGEDTRVQIWENRDRDETIREVMYAAPTDDFELRSKSRREILRSRIIETSGIEEADRVIEEAVERANNNDGGPEGRYAPEFAVSETVDNVSELIEMEGGVTYKVRFDGEIETFAAPGHRGGGQGNLPDSIADCLVSIDHFGEDINLQNLVYLGGENLTSVPANLPASVKSLRGAFENATHFNDSNISSWDVSNIHTLRGMFHNAHSFNRDLSGWDTSSLVHAHNMFSRAHSFNQDISGWDVSNLVYANNMFANAYSFNQDLSGWNTGNVVNMYRMFGGTTVFKQNLSEWDVDNVEDFRRFYIESALEPEDVPERFRGEG